MNREPLCVAVCGGIAVGKTTLVQRLAPKLPNCLSMVEYPERNPYLADFYADMKRWAFHSRMAMLAMFAARYQTLNEIPPITQIVLTDRCLHELVVFAELQHSVGNLSAREFSTYKTLHEGFITLAPQLDVVIYLMCSKATALRRVRERGRSFELGIDESYIDAVAQQYQKWLTSLPSFTRILSYDTDSTVDLDNLAHIILAETGIEQP